MTDRSNPVRSAESAEEYLRTSIIHPAEFIVPGFQDVMQKNFGDMLTSDQINDLIVFLMTEKFIDPSQSYVPSVIR